MREPWETLLGQYRDHWLLWRFFQADDPDWPGLLTADWSPLSRGEQIMLSAAAAFYNGDPTCRLADLGILDENNRARIVFAIAWSMNEVRS